MRKSIHWRVSNLDQGNGFFFIQDNNVIHG